MNRGIRIEWRVSGSVSNCKKLLESMAGIEGASARALQKASQVWCPQCVSVGAPAEHYRIPSTVNHGIRVEWRASGGVSNSEKLLESMAGIEIAAARALQKASSLWCSQCVSVDAPAVRSGNPQTIIRIRYAQGGPLSAGCGSTRHEGGRRNRLELQVSEAGMVKAYRRQN